MKYLAIDYGTKRTGLALCDRDETIASPFAVIEDKANLIEKIIQTVKEQSVDAVIIGLPLNMDDTEGPQAKAVRKLAEKLKNVLDLPIYLQDERLSSFYAEDKLLNAELTEKKKRKIVNSVAAAEILQTFLENKKRQRK